MVLQLKTLPYGATESDSWRRWLKVDCISLMIAYCHTCIVLYLRSFILALLHACSALRLHDYTIATYHIGSFTMLP